MGNQKAVRNGKAFESKVFAVLNQIPGVRVKKDIPYPSIYSAYSSKHKTKMEFRAENLMLTFDTLDSSGNTITKTRRFNTLNIECKYQEESGTTDEKYPLVYENAMISDADATLFLYEDPLKNIKRGALDFMYDKALHSGERLIVMEFDHFLACIKQQYGLILHKEDLEQGNGFFTEHHSGLVMLESASRQRFNKAVRNEECGSAFEQYLGCQRNFHTYLSNFGARGEQCEKFQAQLRELRTGISTYLN